MALVVKNPPANARDIRDMGLIPGSEDPLEPTLEFSPGECHGQRSLSSYSPWGLKESDTNEVT